MSFGFGSGTYRMPAQAAYRRSLPSLAGDPVRVLIAEDDDAMAGLVETMLGTDPRIEVVGRARHGGEAVSLALSLDPGVILMDLQIPVMDGVEATRRLRSLGLETRIVVLTAVEETGRIAQARAAGADTFVAKVPTAAQLARVILAGRSHETD